MASASRKGLGWIAIIRLGLVQASVGAIVMLATSLLNRVMVVEYALPASLPAGLVAWHYAVQLSRPLWGHGSDKGRKRTPWIIGGMFILGLGGVLAALGTTLIPSQYWLGMSVSAFGFFAIGVGTGATGTSLLALLAKHVAPERKPAAAALVWFMMIIGFAVTAGVAGHFLDPYSPERLLIVTSTVSALAMIVTLAVIRGIEPNERANESAAVESWLAGMKLMLNAARPHRVPARPFRAPRRRSDQLPPRGRAVRPRARV